MIGVRILNVTFFYGGGDLLRDYIVGLLHLLEKVDCLCFSALCGSVSETVINLLFSCTHQFVWF